MPNHKKHTDKVLIRLHHAQCMYREFSLDLNAVATIATIR
jgi:hypothetical protein